MKKQIILFSALLFSLQNLSAQIAIDYSDYPDAVTFMNKYIESTDSSHAKLTLMHKPKKLSKLGKEFCKGDISGTLSYRTKIAGFCGVVKMKYTDYSDFEGWILNGYTNTKANMNANGKMFGTVEVSGLYKAKICYDNLKIKKGNAGGGYYVVEYGDGRTENVAWDAIKNKNIPCSDADEEVDEKLLEELK